MNVSEVPPIGDVSWMMESIYQDTYVAVIDRSYIKELHLDMCLTAFVLKYSTDRGRIFGSFPEQTITTCVYHGELAC